VGAALATRPGCRGGDTRHAAAAGGGGTSRCTRGLRCLAGAPLWWLEGRSGTPRGQFATRGTVRDGAAAATAAGHGGRAVCGLRRAAAAVAGVVAGACQRRSSRGGGGSLPRRASTAFDGFRLDAVKHMGAPLHYALAGGRGGRGMVGGAGCAHDGGRVADRRLLYHPWFPFYLLSDLPRNLPG